MDVSRVMDEIEDALYDFDLHYQTHQNEIEIVRKELDYAKKCHSIESFLEFPLEIVVAVFKAIAQGFIYVDINGEERQDYVSLEYGDISPDEEPYMGCHPTPFNYHYTLDHDGCVFVEDYKKTWWLKEDRSE